MSAEKELLIGMMFAAVLFFGSLIALTVLR